MAAPRSDFYRVLSAAIDDFMERGFGSQERLQDWLQRLRSSAFGALASRPALLRTLRAGLTQAYDRTLGPTRLMKRHAGVSAFTLANVRPALRSELDRRIAASADLITLNRDASIQRTLQRFAGWASSVPLGGTDVGKRRKVKESVRRGIAGLPFEERRVVIDQGHKLAAAIDDIIASDGGAIAGRWRHVKEGPPSYDSRPSHVARDGKVFLLRESWARKAGLVKPGPAGYADEVTQPAEEPFCSCWYEYLYNLDDLPPAMLTAKGKAKLKEVRDAA